MLHKSLIEGLSVLGGGPYQDKKDSVFPMHSHACWELVYYRSGTVHAEINGEKYTAHPGVVLLTPPGEAHSDVGVTAYKNFYLALDIKTRPGSLQHRFVDNEQADILHCCKRIVSELAQELFHREDMLSIYANELRILIERAHEEYEIEDYAVQEVHKMVSYMLDNISRPMKISDLAKQFHCPLSTMRDWFYKLHQCSPQQYLIQIRLQRAYSLLAHSSMKLSAISYSCGFDSVSHLSRVVKQHSGLSPGRLREKMHMTN